MAFKPLQRPASMTTLLDSGFALYRDCIKQVFLLSAIFAFLYLLPELIFPNQYIEVDGKLRIEANSASELKRGLQLVLGIVEVYLSTLVLFIALSHSESKNSSVNQAMKVIQQNWLSILLVVVAYSVLVSVGLVIVLVPGIYAFVTFMFGIFFVVLENDGPFLAMKKSFYLMQGNWWRSFGFVVIVVSFLLFVVFVIASVFSISFQPGNLYNNELPLSYYVLSYILVVLLLPLVTSMQIVLFRDLNLRNAAFNLE